MSSGKEPKPLLTLPRDNKKLALAIIELARGHGWGRNLTTLTVWIEIKNGGLRKTN
jgi:hypothetical protein